ncbi:MAG: hypothetical protein JNL58_31705 [Planctomyces sp.]|nr:hypothetical protein [Planctomyces sp.]
MKPSTNILSCKPGVRLFAVMVVMSLALPVARAQSDNSVPDAWIVAKNEELVRNTLLVHDDQLIQHREELQALKDRIDSLQSQLDQKHQQLDKRLQGAEQDIKTNRQDIEAIHRNISALDEELKKRLQAREASTADSRTPIAKDVTTISSLKPPAETVVNDGAVHLANFNVVGHAIAASLWLEDGSYFVEIPSTGNAVNQHPVRLVSTRPCASCKDVLRLNHASFNSPLMLTWHGCKKEYLLVRQ